MLTSLALKDFVIADAVEVSLSTGFSALTGETGAGKSILIDALQLALGERADASVVREGAARAEIAARFDCPPALAEQLDAAGFDMGVAGGERELLVRRVIEASGRSRAFINGSAATLAQLREIAPQLVDIHGQHAWQSLTDAAAVRDLLDAYAGAQEAARATAAMHAQWRAAVQRLEEAQAMTEQHRDLRERLQWQLAEVAKLAPLADEWPALNEEHSRMAHAQALIEGSAEASQWLGGGQAAEAGGAARALARAIAALHEVQQHDAARLSPIADQLVEAQTLVTDAARELEAYASRTEVDPSRLAQVDERLSLWVSLARRFRAEPAELPALLAHWQTQLAALDEQADLDALRAQLAHAHGQWREAAQALAAKRRAAAPRLAEQVTALMATLGMGGGQLAIDWQSAPAPQAYGLETPVLLVAGHAGATPRPLAKVASGGELSRLALAIAVAGLERASGADLGTQGAGAATLIFDEIDAGIGGAVADRVGQLLRRLGERVQVLAVTHLPQVAAAAHAHWVVSKTQLAGHTTSHIDAVSGTARTEEIARMLGGEKASRTRLAHAQELLALCAKEGDA